MAIVSVIILAMLTLARAGPHGLQTRNGVSSRRNLQTALTAESECVPGYVDLTFNRSMVTQNNLGGVGPDEGEEKIVFSNVGSYLGDSVNMVVSIKPGAEYVVGELARNGMVCNTAYRSCEIGGDFGQVNLESNRETTLLFQFQSNSTGQPVVLPGFLFSGLDIDGVVKEETYIIKGWETAWYDRNNTETYFSEDEPGYCDNGGGSCLYAQSILFGNVCDNPLDAMNLTKVTCMGLTVDQKARSFLLAFTNKSEFEVYFRTIRPEIDYGRNFLFAFASSWADGCMLPPTPATDAPTGMPTTAPVATPTVAPTAGPVVAPTAGPVVAPTAGPVVAPTAGPVVAPTAGPVVAPNMAPVVTSTAAPITSPTSPPIKAATTGKPAMPPVTSSPVVEVMNSPPTCPPVGGKGNSGKGMSSKVPDDARTESNSSKAKSGKGKSEKRQRILGVRRDECPEADSEEGSGKGGSGKGGSGKGGSGKGGSGKGGSGKGGSGKGGSGKGGSGKGGSGKGGSEEPSSGKGSSGKGSSGKGSSGKGGSGKGGSEEPSSGKGSSGKGGSGKGGSEKTSKETSGKAGRN